MTTLAGRRVRGSCFWFAIYRLDTRHGSDHALLARRMRREFAAQYCDLTMAALIRQVLVEKFPSHSPRTQGALAAGSGR